MHILTVRSPTVWRVQKKYKVWIPCHDAAVSLVAPLEAPAVRLKGKPGHNEAELVWNEIPQRSLRGFITNYTIFYSSGADAHRT